jgi:Tfp pilus assembly protein PilE
MQSNLSKHLINFVSVHVSINKMIACVILNKKKYKYIQNSDHCKISLCGKLQITHYRIKVKSEVPVVRQKNNLVHGVKFN